MAEIAMILHQPLSEMADWTLTELVEWRDRARRLRGSALPNV